MASSSNFDPGVFGIWLAASQMTGRDPPAMTVCGWQSWSFCSGSFVGLMGFCLSVLTKTFLIGTLGSVASSACAAPRREPPRLVFDIRSVDQSRWQRVHSSCDFEAYAAVARTKI